MFQPNLILTLCQPEDMCKDKRTYANKTRGKDKQNQKECPCMVTHPYGTPGRSIGMHVLEAASNGEWTGPWSDDSSKWTDERREKLGHQKSNDGAFWMEDEDCVHVLKRIRFNRTFGPTWQCCAQYGHFGKAPPYTAMAKNSYRACEDDEISFKRGDVIEVTKVTGETWLVGVHKETGNKGYFRKKDVDLRCEDTFKYELTVSNVSPDARIIVGVFRQNQKKMREWYKRRDGMHYKDTDYPTAYLHIYDASGKRLVKHKLTDDDRCGWKYLKPSRGPFTMYIACKSTQHKRFALYAFAPHGQLRWKQLECDRGIFASEVGGAGGAVDEIREFIYDQTHTVLNEYFHLGKELLSGNPEIAGKIMAVASTVGEIIDAEGIRDVAEDAADQVRTLMNSDEVQNVTSQVGDQAQELANQVGNLMNRASSWFG
ncbi:unnamed protein product [Durusdinium trenchii]|uniref:SH3 domain-containing protein n=1 Tax=Durusdinium trenchii TaxID=1381693 RepID=A0ABP0JY81_9DINO